MSTNLRKLQAFLEDQDSQYLDEIKAKQTTLQSLIDTIELKENYTLQATQKQLELNTIENELLVRLQEATNAGSQEAQYLLEVAANNNFATAAEIYYTDYRDLMTDTGGGCTGGIATIEDAQKADYYYQEMLKYRALQEQAQEQADYFTQVKAEAQAQIDLIEEQKAIAETEFNQIQTSINNTQEDIESLEQQLNIAELRIDALEYLINWTEQTLVQVLQVEQLNLAQATLEQEFATQRQLGIDETINAKFERQQADIKRDRAIATAKLEQLNQLQAEDALQQALNDLRSDLGLQPIEDIIQQAEYKGQLAGILSELETIQSQPELPENIQTILAETTADIHEALQGKEAATIQENLLNSANALITEANKLQTAIAKLDAEEVQLLGILEQSQDDLKGATKALYDETIISQELREETDEINQGYLEVLYKIGYAEGAVDLSSELAKQSKDILNQIIEGRIEERKARKKAFVNELLGTVTTVLAVAGFLLTGGASLGLYGAISSLASLGTNLTLVTSAISSVQEAYNGDWSGAIFNLAMTVVSYKISSINSQIADAEKAVDIAKNAKDIDAITKSTNIIAATQKLESLRTTFLPNLKSLQTFEAAAKGTYNTYRAIESKDTTLAFLSAIQGVANVVAIDRINIGETLDQSTNFSNFEKALITAGQISVTAHQAIEAIENGELLSTLESISQIAGTIGTNFATELTQDNISNDWLTLKSIIIASEVSVDVYKTIEAIEDGEWLDALKSIPKVAKGIKNIQEKLEKQASQGENSNSSDASNTPDNNQGLENEDSNSSIFATIQNEFEQLSNKFEEYKDELETYITDKFGLDFDDIENIGQTIEIGQYLYEDGSVQSWLNGINDILKTWDTELTKILGDGATFNVDNLQKLNQTIIVLYNANEQDNINAWLLGVKDTFGIWEDDLREWVYNNFYDAEVIELAQQFNINPADIQVNDDGEIYYSNSNNLKILIGLKESPSNNTSYLLEVSPEAQLKSEEIDKLSLGDMKEALNTLSGNLKEEVITDLQNKYGDPQSWIDTHPILLADNTGDETIIAEALLTQEFIKKEIFISQYKVNWNLIAQYEGNRHLEAYIPEDEAKLIDIAKKTDTLQKLEKNYNKFSNVVDFKQLSPAIQTTIASVAFQYGTNLHLPAKDGGTPKFWKEVTNQNWVSALQELHKFGDKYPTRRRKEAYQFADSMYNIQTSFKTNQAYDIEKVDPLTGIGKNDTLTGLDNQGDLFILGNAKGSFYDNNILSVNGTNDYAEIKNFELENDYLQLKGNSNDYVLGSTTTGQAIYLKTSGEDELIGILEGVNNFDLNKNVIYVGE